MKKTVAIMLAALMIMSLSACGSKKPADSKANSSQQQYVANPWVEVSADTMYNSIGFRFGVPDGATNVIYRWDEEDGIAEMQFTDAFGVNITARAKKTEAFEDISGMYYDFSQNPDNYGHGPDLFLNNETIENLRGDWHLLDTENGMVNLGMWFYKGSAGSYSFTISAVTDSGVIDLHYNEVFVLNT